jgi:hypothetical protein
MYTMKESVAVAKESDAKKGVSPTRSDNSIHRVRDEPERQLGSLRDVIGNIRRDGCTPSAGSIATELSNAPFTQRASVLLALQQTHGNRYVQRVVAGIQAKVKVGQPNDIYEQEADRVADEVMRMPEPQVQRQEEEEKKKEEEKLIQTKTLSEQITPLVQRQAEEKEEEEEEILQTKENPGLTPGVIPDLEARIQSLKSGGQPLPEANRWFMERRFGIDFSGVRLHTDSDAAQMSRELNAQAFTIGRDIYFGVGKYSPSTSSGKRLLAHELTHVVQQDDYQATPMLMRSPLFTSTLSICHQYLRSRNFQVTEGGLRVTINANWGGEEPESPLPRGCRQDRPFRVELRDVGWILDDPWGTCEFPTGTPASRIWTNLSAGEYYLGINTPDTGPYCCLRGNIEVAQERGLSGPTCTQPPPGPLEILHDALDIAGLIPALGAIPDGINLIIYAAERDWANAGISAAAIIPVIGGAAVVVRRGRQVVRVSGEAVERVGRDQIAAGLREARAARMQLVETAGERGARALTRRIAGTRGLVHSFDEHAAQWFGRTVPRQTHLAQWQAIIERTARSRQIVDWSTRGVPTFGHLARIEGKYFFVEFFKSGPRAGELATAFVPSQRQLSGILNLLR